jgi:hypothetical protein
MHSLALPSPPRGGEGTFLGYLPLPVGERAG